MGWKFDATRDLGDLTGKVVIVTGGNKGLGLATVKHLVGAGAKVYMAARSESAAKDAIKEIEASNPKGSVQYLQLDLGDPRKAQEAAKSFLKLEQRLDILISNAGLMHGPYSRPVDDISDIMMINGSHIGPFVLTQTLLPLLEATSKLEGADVRVVIVASEAHQYAPAGLTFKSTDDFNREFKSNLMPWFGRYSQSKLANILYCKELQRRLQESGSSIVVISTYPGAVYTFGDRLSSPTRLILTPLIRATFKTPAAGALIQCYAAVDPAIRSDTEKWKGSYVMNGKKDGHFDIKLGKPTEQAQNAELGKELWATTQGFLDKIGVEKVEP